MTTYAQARDDMSKLVTDAFKAHDPAMKLFYDDMVVDQQPKDGRAAWARLHIQHNASDQDTFANPFGQRLFNRNGYLTVQIFTPLGKGLYQSDTLAKVATDALEGKRTPNGVWFRKVRLREIGPDAAWYQVNVLAEFNYEEAK